MANPVDPNRNQPDSGWQLAKKMEKMNLGASLKSLDDLMKIFPPMNADWYSMPFYIRFSHLLTPDRAPRWIIIESAHQTLEGISFQSEYSFDLEKGEPKGLQSAMRKPRYFVSVLDLNKNTILLRAEVILKDHETLYIAIREDGTSRIRIFGKIAV